MDKFNDSQNDEIDSNHRNDGKKSGNVPENSQLSFRKLAAEKETLGSGMGVSKGTASDKDIAGGKADALYKKACAYLSAVFNAVRQGKAFSLDPGLRIVEEMVEGHSSDRELLFIKALHYDDKQQFVVNNNVNVAIFALKMAEGLGWNKQSRLEIGMAGLLHNVGMGLIPEKLIFKQERLSEEEIKIFQERSGYSYKILSAFGDKHAYLAECAVQVNERFDGSGYPRGLKGDEIHEYAQIVGLVDMYEALIHSRPQRAKLLHFSATKEILKSGKNLFQRKHLKVLLNNFSVFPIYSYVRLNTGAIGRVIETYPNQPMRPRLKIVFDAQKRSVLAERIVNLPESPLLFLVDSVSEEELQELSEAPVLRTHTHVDTKGKNESSSFVKKEGARVEDIDPSTDAKEKKSKTGKKQKSNWVKLALFFAVAAVLVAGLITQFGGKGFEAGNPEKKKSYVVKNSGHRTVPKGAVVSPPPETETRSEQNNPSVDENVAVKGVSHDGKTPMVFASTRAAENLDKVGLATKKINVSHPYSIQLASCRSRESAEKNIKIFTEKKLSPYWVKVNLGDKGTWFRVFEGHFENVQKAEEVIKRHQIKGARVKKTKYSNLIGTYSSEAALNAKSRVLLDLGFSPYVIKDNNGRFNLCVGAFFTKKGAKDLSSDLISSGIQSQVVER